MKITSMTLALCALTIIAKPQEVGVEQTNFGVQIGALGVWVNNESKLSRNIALRSEIGFDGIVFGSMYYAKTGWLFAPVLSLEPRWYYNLQKRDSRSKRIDGNSGNFISLKTSYVPDAFVISNYGSDTEVFSYFALVPTWGIRRAIGQRFIFEAGIGIGYRYVFATELGYNRDVHQASGNLLLRFGYKF